MSEPETTPVVDAGDLTAEAQIRAAAAAATVVDLGDYQPPLIGDGNDVVRKCVPLPLNDYGNGLRLVRHFGARLLWVPGMGWLRWDGNRWCGEQGDLRAHGLAQRLGQVIQREATLIEEEPSGGITDKEWEERVAKRGGWSVTSGNSSRIRNALDESKPFLKATPDSLDALNFTVASQSCSIDLGLEPGDPDNGLMPEGTIHDRPADRTDRITRSLRVAYDPDATAPQWERFIEQVQPDPDCRAFLQRWVGYCLTGSVQEQVILCNYGRGSNGKSVFQDILQEMLGDYALSLPFESFVHDDRRRGGEATPDLAELPGVRVAISSEPENGATLSEGMIKRLTGDEPVMVRKLNQPPFTFRPRFKVMLSFNERPKVRGQDFGIWRRILLLPWTACFVDPENMHLPGALPKDPLLKDKLRAELPGILNWALQGYCHWRTGGLQPPDTVREAVAQYKADSNPIAEFAAAALVPVTQKAGDPGVFGIQGTELFAAYKRWCEAQPIDALSMTAFGRRMSAMGYEKEKCGVVRYKNVMWNPEFQFKDLGEPSNRP